MHQAAKTTLKKLVNDLRYLLEKDLETTLKGYGFFIERPWLPADQLPGADQDIQITRQTLEAAIIKDQTPTLTRGDLTRRYLREATFIHLNRLILLKCLEIRGLCDEVISPRLEYGNRSHFHHDFRHHHPDLARQAGDALPAVLKAAYRQLSNEVTTFLFASHTAADLIWPRSQALRQAIDQINTLPAEIWAEDEIIGWAYQFYNAKEKSRTRQQGRPQSPGDVAIINQFFTPRWVVKFLVDNTLGRLWLEMYPDSERVRAKCDTLLPELLPGTDQVDPSSPINNPQAPPGRPAKPITQIRLIDPACGTMHFGYYAFEVFQLMYRDAGERGKVEGGRQKAEGRKKTTIQNPKSKIQNRPVSDIPALILRYNLYGADTDPRAVQLARLGLYLKARAVNPGADPVEAGEPLQMNFICANTPLPGGDVRACIRQHLADKPSLQQTWADLLKQLGVLAQVGTLFRLKDPAQLRHFRRLVRSIRHEDEAQLRHFAENVSEVLTLLEMLQQDYEVVVMNPPFGYTSAEAARYLTEHYPISKINLLCAFVERAQVDLTRNGYVGALLDRTFLVKSSYQKFRRDILLNRARLKTVADLGWGVLDDAQVETACLVLGPKSGAGPTICLKLAAGSPENLAQAVREAHQSPPRGSQVFVTPQEDFTQFPNAAFAYWAPPTIRRAFAKHPPLDPTIASARKGIDPCQVDRFVRYHWEVDPATVGQGKKWVPLANGGSYSPYYRGLEQVILYENDAWALRNYRNKRGEIATGMRNPSYQFRGGITYGKRTDFLNAQRLEPGVAFSQEGQGVFPHDEADTWPLLAMLNSKVLRFTINLVCGQHKTSGYVGLLPYVRPSQPLAQQLAKWAQLSHNLKAAWDAGNETSTRFSKPWLLQLADSKDDAFDQGLGRVLKLLGWPGLAYPITLEAILAQLTQIEQAADARLQTTQARIDRAIYDLYEVSSADQAQIDKALANSPPERIWPAMNGKSDEFRRQSHVCHFLSYFIRQAIQRETDGIMPLLAGLGKPTALDRLREGLEATFGPKIALQLEEEAGQVLGRPVAQWLAHYFSRWHAKLYRRRPIIWQIAGPGGGFRVLVDYHKLDQDTLPKIRRTYLASLRDNRQQQLAQARSDQDNSTANRLETTLDNLALFDKRLGQLTSAAYNPTTAEGIKVNIAPLQETGILQT